MSSYSLFLLVAITAAGRVRLWVAFGNMTVQGSWYFWWQRFIAYLVLAYFSPLGQKTQNLCPNKYLYIGFRYLSNLSSIKVTVLLESFKYITGLYIFLGSKAQFMIHFPSPYLLPLSPLESKFQNKSCTEPLTIEWPINNSTPVWVPTACFC